MAEIWEAATGLEECTNLKRLGLGMSWPLSAKPSDCLGQNHMGHMNPCCEYSDDTLDYIYYDS